MFNAFSSLIWLYKRAKPFWISVVIMASCELLYFLILWCNLMNLKDWSNINGYKWFIELNLNSLRFRRSCVIEMEHSNILPLAHNFLNIIVMSERLDVPRLFRQPGTRYFLIGTCTKQLCPPSLSLRQMWRDLMFLCLCRDLDCGLPRFSPTYRYAKP